MEPSNGEWAHCVVLRMFGSEIVLRFALGEVIKIRFLTVNVIAAYIGVAVFELHMNFCCAHCQLC